jgi:hypothetical protein
VPLDTEVGVTDNNSNSASLFGSPFLGISCLFLHNKQSNSFPFILILDAHNEQTVLPHGKIFGSSSCS